MGGHSEIRKIIKGNIAPTAFKQQKPDFKDKVVIEDVLTRFRRYTTRDGSGLLAGREIAEYFCNYLWNTVIAGGATVYVFCCDSYAYVPSRKIPEEKKRDEILKTPYPDESEIDDKGIQYPGSAGIEGIDIHRALSSRKVVREKLMTYIRTKIK